MLKDDAIRAGLILPSKADVERMNLSKDDLKEIRAKNKAHEEAAKGSDGAGN